MSVATPIKKIKPGKAVIPKGYAKVIYLGGRKHMSMSRPYTTDDETGEVIFGGRQSYTWDKKDEHGNRYDVALNPVHIWSFLLRVDGDGQKEFEIEKLPPKIRNRIKGLQAIYTMPNPQNGTLRSRAETTDADAVFAMMGI